MTWHAVVAFGHVVLLAGFSLSGNERRVNQTCSGRTAETIEMKGCGGTIAAFSQDGKLLLTAGGDSARVWNSYAGLPLTPPLRHDGRINAARFAPAGNKVVTAGIDGTVRVWDIATGKPVFVVKHEGPVLCAAFSPDGARIVSGSQDKTARIWEVDTGRQLQAWRFGSEVDQVSFNPRRDEVMTLAAGKISLFDIKTGKLMASPKREELGVCFHAEFSPDGKHMVASGESSACVVDVDSGAQIAAAAVHQPDSMWRVNASSYAPDGSKFATATTGFVQIWDAATGKPLTGKLPTDEFDNFETIAFSRDGKRLFAGGNSPVHNNNVWAVWDATSGKLVQLVRCGSSASGYAISPDGTRVAAGGPVIDCTSIWTIGPTGN